MNTPKIMTYHDNFIMHAAFNYQSYKL